MHLLGGWVQVNGKVRIGIGISVNVLVILKTFVDPIIYAARMSDIQVAHLTLLKLKLIINIVVDVTET